MAQQKPPRQAGTPAGPTPPVRQAPAAPLTGGEAPGPALEWVEPALPNGGSRTYLSAGGAAIVAVTFLLFVSLLVAYFASSTSWAPW